MQALPLEKIKQIGEMFRKKNEREEGCNSVKAKQEFIHKQEELALWIEAGGKLVMKRIWELSPA